MSSPSPSPSQRSNAAITLSLSLGSAALIAGAILAIKITRTKRKKVIDLANCICGTPECQGSCECTFDTPEWVPPTEAALLKALKTSQKELRRAQYEAEQLRLEMRETGDLLMRAGYTKKRPIHEDIYEMLKELKKYPYDYKHQ
jgi:hypothetical protein